jgi:hypothetical protein
VRARRLGPYGDGVAPVLGELIGRGVTSDVHAWRAGTVVKVFSPRFAALADVQHDRARRVHAAGAPCPRVHELTDVGGRPGVVFDRLDGPSLLAERGAAEELAHVHVALHELSAPDLPQMADTLAAHGIGDMPTGHSLFHGDLHPGNVLRHAGRWHVIDWSNAHLAPPAADVACSVVSIGYRGAHGPDASVEVHRRRVQAAERYLDAYRTLRPAELDDIGPWIGVIGRLLIAQEPDLAFADELANRWPAAS